MTKHIVIGGSGFTGSHLVRTLLAQGQQVQTVDLLPLPAEFSGRVVHHQLDILDTAALSRVPLDEGDVVRILRRTLDFLSQIPHVPCISDSLRQNAYRAMQLIDRFPVNEAVE